MVESIVTQPFGLVLIIAAHVVLNDAGHAEVTGIVGQSITLQFTFNTTITRDSNLAIYKTREQKIASYSQTDLSCCEVYPENSTVFYHISNLTLNHTEVYWAVLFENGPVIKSNKVQLIVRAENRSTTVPPTSTNLTTQKSDGSSFFLSSRAVVVLLVSPMMLLLVLLPFFFCCSLKTQDQQQEPQRNSNPTLQETIDGPINMPGPSLVYSVLDFPKRPPAPVEFSPSGTEYATVSYLTEKRYRT